MLAEQPDDRFDDVPVGAVAALHVDVGLGIGLALDTGELLERRLGIVGLQQRPGVAAAQSVPRARRSGRRARR
jgi:hypothetical protein